MKIEFIVDYTIDWAYLKAQLEKLNSIGMNKIVPTEGIVFKYQGKTYKFTGAFAPINQITGLMAF